MGSSGASPHQRRERRPTTANYITRTPASRMFASALALSSGVEERTVTIDSRTGPFMDLGGYYLGLPIGREFCAGFVRLVRFPA